MNKLLSTLIVAGALTSGAAMAATESFDVVVDVQNVSKNLAIAQVSPIIFPVVTVDESTKAGAKCYTSYDSSSSYNALCRDSVASSANRKAGLYRVTGTKLAPITVSLSDSVNLNGLKFTPSFHNYNVDADTGKTISSSGEADLDIRGFLELVDPAAVSTQQTTFTFDITATYN